MKTILLISKNYEDAVVSLSGYKLEMLDSGFKLKREDVNDNRTDCNVTMIDTENDELVSLRWMQLNDFMFENLESVIGIFSPTLAYIDVDLRECSMEFVKKLVECVGRDKLEFIGISRYTDGTKLSELSELIEKVVYVFGDLKVCKSETKNATGVYVDKNSKKFVLQ